MATKDTLVLAHYYTIPEVQEMADFVGDSLELALIAKRESPKRIVMAGVKFMGETMKIINPETEVIIPDGRSTCSLVEQTNIKDLKNWVDGYRNCHDVIYEHVAYINSSAEHKAMSDWIVTSRNVDDIIQHIYEKGNKVIFSPDRNMGEYLNYINNYDMPTWFAVCEVHDQFSETKIEAIMNNPDGRTTYLIAHPESPLPVLKRANMVGSTSKMLDWINKFDPVNHDSVIYVATEEGLLYNMRKARPGLDIQQAPIYTGCQCNQCPYMKFNTIQSVTDAISGKSGSKIDYLSDTLMDQARIPIDRMINFSL